MHAEAFLSPQDLLIIGVIVLVLFGGRKIPELAKGLGEGMKEFKKATRDEEQPAAKAPESAPTPPQETATPESAPTPAQEAAAPGPAASPKA